MTIIYPVAVPSIPYIAEPNQRSLPADFLPFDEFTRQFSLGETSTEQAHEKTRMLSQVMRADVVKGLEMLLDADQEVLAGYDRFIPVIQSLAPELAARLNGGGRIFLIGSGSSGRVAIDLAAKCNQAFAWKEEQIRGVIAGGDAALIRAREGFEDSEAEGEKSLQPFHVGTQDTIFLISASGSASFNVGCGHFAANRGAKVLYFYNSKSIPVRTEQLFRRSNNPVRPLEVDIGAQAISGSTRLQGASLAELCLGALLGATLLHLQGSEASAATYPKKLLEKMGEGNQLLAEQLGPIAEFVKREAAIFLSPNANFLRLRDETSQGYVTFVGDKNTMREILIDVTEASPTFSTNPIRREAETLQKREEFRAYLLGQSDHRAVWNVLMGRDVEKEAVVDTEQYILAMEATGNNSYDKRPIGAGNFVIGVTKVSHPAEISEELMAQMDTVVKRGGGGGLIVLCRRKVDLPSNASLATLFLENVPFDHLGLVETLLLKQILNLISNGSMVLTNKVHGNRMIDVRASNYKLIDRSLRLIKEVWGDSSRPLPCSDQELYHTVAQVCVLKKMFAESGMYSPSIVKIVLAMLYLGKEPTSTQFQEVVRFLANRQERLDFLEQKSYTFCIDGGGSKTLLQIIDREGNILPLTKKGKTADFVEGGSSNINVVKKEGVKAALQDLFEGLQVGVEQTDFREILPASRIIAGMAGVGLRENIDAVTSLFGEVGISKKGLLLLTDAELALRLLKGNGIVLIAGTGSICFAEKSGVRQRVGGLGRILGDEGSGYQIGLQAIRAGMAEEFGYGPPTHLTSALKAFFGVAELKNLLPQVNSSDLSAAAIASASPLVFEQAAKQDPVAKEIVSQAAEELRQLVATALKITQLADCELHLWGGVFKDCAAETIIESIIKEAAPRRITVINQSKENATVIFARMFRE